LSAYFVRGDDLLAVMRPGEAGGWSTRCYHADGLGSIRALTDETGTVTDRWSYTAFGELVSHQGSDPQAYLFAGAALDPNSGFYYLRARWMDPGVGRFASADTFAGSSFEPTTLHKYLYAGQDPVDRVDPSGLESLASVMVSFAVAGMVNAMLGVVLGNNVPADPDFWSNFLRDFLWGAALAPVGGVFSKIALRLLKPLAPRLLTAIGSARAIMLRGKGPVERLLVRLSRLVLNTNRHPPGISSNFIGRLLKKWLPSFSWEAHHLVIQQAWTGGASPLYTRVAANEGLRRLGNGLWNLAPIPRFLNSSLGSTPIMREVGTPIFATLWYSTLFFGPWQTIRAVSGDDY
jgi:RHS repeat-associated protein